MCKHNVFRSRVAEAFFNKFNKNKNYVASSAGLLPGKSSNEPQVNVANKFGININGTPQAITIPLLEQTNLMVIVADNVPSEIFNNVKYERQEIVWRIVDDNGSGPEETYEIIKKIGDKVKKFVEELK